MADRKFDDMREFDVDDEVEFVYDDVPNGGDNKKYKGAVVAVRYKEDEQQIKHEFRYTVQFEFPKDKEGLREVQCRGSELTLIKAATKRK